MGYVNASPFPRAVPNTTEILTMRITVKSAEFCEYPGQKAIIASGFSETDRIKEAQRLGAGAYIKKPFLLEKLGIAIKEELEK